MTQYSKYLISNDKRESSFQFFECGKLPSEMPVSTPFTFPFIGEKIVLCLDKNGWWNPLGGHVEKGEDFKETLIREAYEEAGVHISKSTIKLVGYIKNVNSKDSSLSKYPKENILPITTSFVVEVDSNWKPMETSDRGLFSFKEAIRLMGLRGDNHQMLEILDFAIKEYKRYNYQANFTYYPNRLFGNTPVTQVFVFCKDEQENFCIVKDQDEDFYSLPGGGCELGENPIACISRELLEEAQMTCKNIKFLGSILVEIKQGTKVVSRFQHLRYLSEVESVDSFIPLKNGFETVERTFVPFDELKKKVFILQNPTAKNILAQVISTQSK